MEIEYDRRFFAKFYPSSLKWVSKDQLSIQEIWGSQNPPKVSLLGRPFGEIL